MGRSLRYAVVDVFTNTPLEGNPLAVFLDADGLSEGEMQALARETNLSETTFCFPRQETPAGIPVRIFTTVEELPFAGHPTLGTAAALRWALPALRDAREVPLGLRAGRIAVRFPAAAPPPALPCVQFGEMDQLPPEFGQLHDPAAVAAALGLPLEAVDPRRAAQTVSTGLSFVVVPLRSQEALRALAVPQAAAAHYLRGTGGGRFFYVLAPGPDSSHWRARMQFYSGEDPATGSAAGCAAAYLVRHGYAAEGAPLVIEQGTEIGRRSLLHCSARLAHDFGTAGGPNGNEAGYVRVGGGTVLVAEGRFFLA